MTGEPNQEEVYVESGHGSSTGKKVTSSSAKRDYNKSKQKRINDIPLGVPMTDLEFQERKLNAQKASKGGDKIMPNEDNSLEES